MEVKRKRGQENGTKQKLKNKTERVTGLGRRTRHTLYILIIAVIITDIHCIVHKHTERCTCSQVNKLYCANVQIVQVHSKCFNLYFNSNISKNLSAVAFNFGMKVDLCMVYILMVTLITLTLMQGQSGSAEEHRQTHTHTHSLVDSIFSKSLRTLITKSMYIITSKINIDDHHHAQSGKEWQQ